MDSWKRVGGLLVLSSAVPCADAVTPLYDPKLCYILDGFLLLYGLVVTGLLLKERFFTTKAQGTGLEKNDSLYSDLNQMNRDRDGYGEIKRSDPERGAARGNRRTNDDTYTPLQRATDDTYKEITVSEQKRRRNKNEQVYQGLSSATKDTYDSLQMQPLPPPPPR